MKTFSTLIAFLFSVSVFATSAHIDSIAPHKKQLFKSTVNGSADFEDLSTILKHGDTLVLQGDYLWFKLRNIQGSSDSPIIIINSGLVNVGGYKPYVMDANGKFFKILGNGDPSYKYGLRATGFGTTMAANGLQLGNSSDYEIRNIEFYLVQSGIQSNPTSGFLQQNCWFHDLWFHNIGDVSSDAGRAECFYLSNTSSSGPYPAVAFVNCIIENCVFDTCTGNAVQIKNGSFIVRNNLIRNTGTSLLYGQISAVQCGGTNDVKIYGNTFSHCQGTVMDCYGTKDSVVFINNEIDTCDVRVAGSTADILYFNGKDAVNLLKVRVEGNVFKECYGRYIIDNATSASLNSGAIFRQNQYIGGGGTISQYVIRTNDVWTPYVALPTITEVFRKGFVYTGFTITIVIYSDGSAATKVVKN